MIEEKARDIAIQILDEFERLPVAKGIKAPSDDRERGRRRRICMEPSTTTSRMRLQAFW